MNHFLLPVLLCLLNIPSVPTSFRDVLIYAEEVPILETQLGNQFSFISSAKGILCMKVNQMRAEARSFTV